MDRITPSEKDSATDILEKRFSDAAAEPSTHGVEKTDETEYLCRMNLH
jgi:hypothetical protein